MQEFFDLKMGSMTMDKYVKKFLDLLTYVDCLKDENIKIQRFLSGLPSFYRDVIQYDEPKSLKEEIRKAKHMYEKNKGKTYFRRSWKDKKQDNQNQRKKGFKPPPFRGSASQQKPGVTSEHNASESDGRKRR